VPLAETELIVAGLIFHTKADPHLVKSWVKGVNWDAQIADTVQSIQELDPMADDYDDQHAAFVAQLREYKHKNKHEATPGRMDEVETCREEGSRWSSTCEAAGHHKFTVGEHFGSLDAEGQRQFLKNSDIRVEKAKLGESDGIHLVVDNRDLGIFRVWLEGRQVVLEVQVASDDPEEEPVIIRSAQPLPAGFTP